MKDKLLKALKIILIIFGILYLAQILLFLLIMTGLFSIGSTKTLDFDFNKVQSSTKPKEITPIINYVEDYQIKNNKYPEKLENVKTKKNLDYKYEISKDGNCYSIELNEKNKVKQYQHCKTASDNSSATSESYVEYYK